MASRDLSSEQIWEEALANEGLLVKVVEGIVKKGIPADLSFDDLMQEGWIALHRAVEQFDPDRGYAFSTFAVPVIRNAVTTAVRRELGAKGANKGHRAMKQFAYVESLDRLQEWITQAHESHSGKHGWATRVEKYFGEEGFEDELVEQLDSGTWMDRLLALDLGERDLDIVLRRLDGMTMPAIGEIHGLTKERVRQVLDRTFDTLRAMDPERVAA